ncbi:hypothetical protein FF1_017933 [Malus domestica]
MSRSGISRQQYILPSFKTKYIWTTLQVNPANKHYSVFSTKKMEKWWWFLALLLLIAIPTEAGINVGGGVGVNVGPIGGGGVWIGGGINNGNGNPPVPSGSSPSGLERAFTALQAWKSAISDDPSKILDSWVGPNVCSYKGVFCSPDSQEVTGIDLNHANLKGNLVQELSLLSQLSLIHLNSNRFSGQIPETLRDLTALQELDLSNNDFSGSFPTVTLQIPNLIYLDLRYNSYSGTIPGELFNQKLDAIFLNNNNFEGEIPESLGNSQASVINFANNQFTGNLPASFGFMGTKLKEILFLNNRLTGCIPEGVGIFTDVKVFDASHNSLMGHLPDTISCLEEIEVLNLAHNELSGVLPDLVCSLKSLENLTVAYNFFSGFSQECTKLPDRNVWFDFSLNCIPGRNMQRPQPECSLIPGGGLNCLRIPGSKPLVCGSRYPSSSP